MSAWRYWEEVIIRTFRATRKSLGWNAQTAVVVIVSLLALAGRWAIQGLPEASEDALPMLLYAVLPALVFLVFALLYHLTHVRRFGCRTSARNAMPPLRHCPISGR